uniref:1,4-dihydroxy-2-naphthoate octaprenyltransferase n=1 Tax=Fibrocapsa japonica TaxID=94617 RepID=A0A7S2UT65_9STRA
MDAFKRYTVASRPWTFTASVIPIAVTAALCKKELGAELFSMNLLSALIVGIGCQAASNLTNSYYDFKYGVDNKFSSGDRSLVEKKISPSGALVSSSLLYLVVTMVALPHLWQSIARGGSEVAWVFLPGMALAYFYTAGPYNLKYHCLGDLAIFLAFGPLLMQFTALLLTGSVQWQLMSYTLPVGLLTEAILHANNTRDIKTDSKAGANTLATVMGYQVSVVLLAVMIIGAYVAAAWITWAESCGAGITFLSLPVALMILKDLSPKKLVNMDERCAQLHLLFGVLLTLGISISSYLGC